MIKEICVERERERERENGEERNSISRVFRRLIIKKY
jgi:hypothetical protein